MEKEEEKIYEVFDPLSLFYEMQGALIKHEDGKTMLFFDEKAYPDIFEKGNIHVFDSKQVMERSTWRPDIIAMRLFGTDEILLLDEPLREGTLCQYNNCPSKATARGLVKIKGIVYEVDLCQTDFHIFHGMEIEDLQFRVK